MEAMKARAAQAQASITSATTKRTGPAPSAYAPNRYDPNAPPIQSTSQRMANSPILTNQRDKVFHRPLPPPKRTSSGESHTPVEEQERRGGSSAPSPPPVLSRSSTMSSAVNASGRGEKPYSAYNELDKAEFFELLDEYFSTRLDLKASLMQNRSRRPAAFTSPSLPPTVASSTRPDLSSQPARFTPKSSRPEELTALAILHSILHDHSSLWYALPNPQPPIAQGVASVRMTMGTRQMGNEKSSNGMAICADGSSAYWNVKWSIEDERRRDSTRVTREGRYRGVPVAWEGDELYAASEMYGPLIVEFAERALAGGRPIGRGECWDLAQYALNEISERNDIPTPFPAIGFAFGHLLFHGIADSRGEGKGTWRGGDGYVRGGDFVQWRLATIKDTSNSGAIYTMGAPDHTAVIVSAALPLSIPTDGSTFSIADLSELTVIEQSPGEIPKESTYDMRTMTAGEIWIYRPVDLIKFVGSEVSAVWPPTCETLSVDQK